MNILKTAGILGGSLGAFFLLMSGFSWNPIISGLVAVGIYSGLSLVTIPKVRIGDISISQLRGGAQMRKLLDDAQEDFKVLVAGGVQIRNQGVRENVLALRNTAEKILKYLEKKPDRIPLARRFFTYYLDLAAKLVSRYREMEETSLKTDEVILTMKKTEAAFPGLEKAFEDQFTHLMEGELLDTNAELDVLKKTLEMEGDQKA